ncbi:MAG TPA: hydrogenase nickel incorporation protein HypB [Methanomassiliicoccales archaeon]|nr:hydrogenase nickel incorporation protein HypB [Methanomassiliicoccales archaeon]
MHKITTIGMETDVLAENRKLAQDNLRLLRSKGVKSVDVMGSIGSGKTALIVQMAKALMGRGKRVAAIAGDVTGEDDYTIFRKAGLPAVNLNTGKECHLDAHLVEHALEDVELDSIDYLFIENVGNLVCPADFPLGTDTRVVVISPTEGDDMVNKHPMIFLEADVAVLNKIDLLKVLDVDVDRLKRDYARIRKNGVLHQTSAKTGEGVPELLKALHLF